MNFQTSLQATIAQHGSYHKSVCGICNQLLHSFAEQVSHKSICKGKKNISCPECGTVFRRKDNLQVHLRNKHNFGHPTICKGCGMYFRSYLRLNEHMSSCEQLVHKPC